MHSWFLSNPGRRSPRSRAILVYLLLISPDRLSKCFILQADCGHSAPDAAVRPKIPDACDGHDTGYGALNLGGRSCVFKKSTPRKPHFIMLPAKTDAYHFARRRTVGRRYSADRIGPYSRSPRRHRPSPDWYSHCNQVWSSSPTSILRILTIFVEPTKFSRWRAMLLQWKGFCLPPAERFPTTSKEHHRVSLSL